MQDGADEAADGAAGDEARSDGAAFTEAQGVEGVVFAAVGDEVRYEAADEDRRVDFHGQVGTEGKGQGRDLHHPQEESEEGAGHVQRPGSGTAVHHGFDDGCHGVGLRCCQGARSRVAVGVVEEEDDADSDEAGDDDGQDLPLLHLLRRCPGQVGDFQFRHEVAGYGQGRAEEGGHEQDGDDAGAAAHADIAHEDGRDDDHEDGHARNGFVPRKGDGADADDGEEEREDEDDCPGQQGLGDVLRAGDVEEEREQGAHGQGSRDNLAHGQVLLGPQEACGRGRARREQVRSGPADDPADDAGHGDQADDAGHGQHADADVTDVLREDGVDGRIGQEDGLSVEGHDVFAAEVVDDGDADEPREERARCDDSCVAQAREVADAQEGGVVIQAESQLVFRRRGLAPGEGQRRQDFLPPAQGVEDEVIGHGQEAAEDHDVGLGTAVAAEDFGSGPAGREGVSRIHFFTEVAAERRRQEDAQDAAEDDGDDHFRIGQLAVELQDEQGRQDEHDAADDVGPGAGDGLDVDRFREGILALEEDGHAHGQDGDGRKGIDGLADFQAEIADGQGEEGGEEQPPADDISIDFNVILVRRHGRIIRAPLRMGFRHDKNLLKV